MGAEKDTKPFFSPITAISRGYGGFSACQTASAAPMESVVRGAAAARPAACVLNRGMTELPEEGGDRDQPRERLEHTSARPPCAAAARISRSFWSAGEYEAADGSSTQPPGYVQNRMCVHPKFLHSNATSHKWQFGALAELLDNAVDEINTGATRIIVDKVINNRNVSPALLVQDDGGGMDPDSLRRCMSFGFSDKQSGTSIGQYGNGFKTSTMRLGADVIVFSRCMKSREATQSIGLLSYTFLAETGQKDVVVPVVDYKYNLLTGEAKPFQRFGPNQFSSNLSVLLKWSPFETEEQLMHNFDDIGPQGTKIVIFNLWSNDDGDLELDFDTEEDILISGAPKPVETASAAKGMNESHLANQLRYSFRVYASILYLQLPEYFKIILRGQEEEVLTIIGFLDGAPTISVHGFSIYHKNRLILPFHRVLSAASSKGRGVAGLLEADFIRPTHDKQDFEKAQLYQKLIKRLKGMTNEYWDSYSHLVGYSKEPRAASAPPTSRALVPTPLCTTAKRSERNSHDPLVSVVPLDSRPSTCDNPSNAIPIAFASPLVELVSAPDGTHVATQAPTISCQSDMQITQADQTRSPDVATGTDLADTRKRKMETLVQMAVPLKRQNTHDLVCNYSMDSSNQVCQYVEELGLNEFSYLKQENEMLRQQCLEFETAEKGLLLKYKSLLNEDIPVTALSTHTRST